MDSVHCALLDPRPKGECEDPNGRISILNL